MKRTYIDITEPDNGLVLLARFLRDWATLDRHRNLGICNDIFSYCTKAVAHPRAFKEFIPSIVSAAQHFSGFTDKQKEKIRNPTYQSTSNGFDREWIPYDGPDDPDRYNGGGDFDIDSGYWIG